MELGDSLPCSHEPATGPYIFSPYFHKIHSNTTLPSTPRSNLSVFLPKFCTHLYPMRATCPAHLILDLVTNITDKKSPL
jgi:hypothetical protein